MKVTLYPKDRDKLLGNTLEFNQVDEAAPYSSIGYPRYFLDGSDGLKRVLYYNPDAVVAVLLDVTEGKSGH